MFLHCSTRLELVRRLQVDLVAWHACTEDVMLDVCQVQLASLLVMDTMLSAC